jgi:G:T-mismatch repair DNA endonuclease (very short patch repair protein)
MSELSKMLGYKCSGDISYYIVKYNLLSYVNLYTSCGERELTKYIRQLGFEVQKKRFKFGEIDVFIPDLNIGFEFNGDYWHGNPLFYNTDFIIKNKKKVKEIWEKDRKKIYEAKKCGIKIYTIWENDWLNNNENIKQYIRTEMNLYKKQNVKDGQSK